MRAARLQPFTVAGKRVAGWSRFFLSAFLLLQLSALSVAKAKKRGALSSFSPPVFLIFFPSSSVPSAPCTPRPLFASSSHPPLILLASQLFFPPASLCHRARTDLIQPPCALVSGHSIPRVFIAAMHNT